MARGRDAQAPRRGREAGYRSNSQGHAADLLEMVGALARGLTARLRPVAQGLARRLRAGQSGQGMVEYAIMLALVAIVAMVAVRALGTGIDEVFRGILASFRTALPAGGGTP